MSKILSAIFSGAVPLASSRPIRRWRPARDCAGYERVGGFLSPIVEETVLSFLRDNGTRLHGSAETAVHPCVGGYDIAR